METQPVPDTDGAFIRTLQTHQKGKTITDVSSAIRNVTEAVSRYSKPGKVVLTMTIYPAAKGQESAFGFECEVIEKMPKSEAYAGLFFADEAHNLVRENPNQPEMPQLRAIGGSVEPEQLRRVEEA